MAVFVRSFVRSSLPPPHHRRLILCVGAARIFIFFSEMLARKYGLGIQLFVGIYIDCGDGRTCVQCSRAHTHTVMERRWVRQTDFPLNFPLRPSSSSPPPSASSWRQIETTEELNAAVIVLRCLFVCCRRYTTGCKTLSVYAKKMLVVVIYLFIRGV